MVKVRVKDGRRAVAKIGGFGNAGLMKYSKVLVRGSACRDLIGVQMQVIRGVKDAKRDDTKIWKRSKYGVKAPEEKRGYASHAYKGFRGIPALKRDLVGWVVGL